MTYEIQTPLGLPVEPEVKIMYASLFGFLFLNFKMFFFNDKLFFKEKKFLEIL